MRDRSGVLVIVALVLLVVALSTLDVSFVPLGGFGRQLLPWLVLGIIVLFVMRSGCCGGRCGGRSDAQSD